MNPSNTSSFKNIHRYYVKGMKIILDLDLLEVIGSLDYIWYKLEKEGTWDIDHIRNTVWACVEYLDCPKKKIVPIIMFAITGKIIGPPLFDSMAILGKNKCIARFNHCVNSLTSDVKNKLDLG